MSHSTESVERSTPCDIADAHGIALMALNQGLDTIYQPFRHPHLQDDEVRIKVTYSGLCQSDTMWMQNKWGMTSFPSVCGHEVLGEVTHLGEKVTSLQIGDRVGHGPMRGCCESCDQCESGFTNLCGKAVLTLSEYGGWATSFQSKAKSFVKVPDSIPGSAAPLFCAGVTVFSPLSRDVTAGMKVGIVGIGGLGHLGIMIANKMGCEVTAISTSPDKELEARELGARHFLNTRDPADVRKHERSLDYILNTATSHNFETDFSLLRSNGVVNVVGAPEIGSNSSFHPYRIIGKQLTIKASAAGSRNEMRNMVEFCRFHNIFPKSEIYEFNDAKKAIDSLALGIPRAPRYRAVFDLNEFQKTFTPNYN